MKKPLAVLVCACLPIFAACSNSTSSSDTTIAESSTTSVSSQVKEITITIGENSGTDVVTEVKQGQEVKITFVNNEANDEIHLHGYDLSTGEMKKGVSSSITFTATKTGDFEMESHVSEEVVQILRVVPS